MQHKGIDPALRKGLPRSAKGLGLRVAYYPELFQDWPAVDYFECLTENFLTAAGPVRERLRRVRSRYPVVLHGVALNLLGHEPLDEGYLDAVKRLADELEAPFVTDHLCWSASGSVCHHDLLPVPFRRDLLSYGAERAAYVQKRLERPFGLENLSSYVSFDSSEMTEWEFYCGVVREAGIFHMLDINNIFVSSVNHRFEPSEYLEAVDWSRVLQVHIAGHEQVAPDLIIDTHDRPVAAPVWSIYAEAWKRGGPFPTLLEWDERIPPLRQALAELEQVEQWRR
jgi:uncharacterized protein (UPF0276 family)